MIERRYNKVQMVRFFCLSFDVRDNVLEPVSFTYITETAKKRRLANGPVTYDVMSDYTIRDPKGKYKSSVLDEAFYKAVGADLDTRNSIQDYETDQEKYIKVLDRIPNATITEGEIALLSDIEAVVNVRYCQFAAERLSDIQTPYETFQGVLSRLKDVVLTKDGLSIPGQAGGGRRLLANVWTFCEEERERLAKLISSKRTNITRHITDPGAQSLERATKTPKQLAEDPPIDIAAYITGAKSQKERLRRAEAIINGGYSTFYLLFDKQPQALPVIYTLIRCMDRAQREPQGTAETTETQDVNDASEAMQKLAPLGAISTDGKSFLISADEFAREFCSNYDEMDRHQRQRILKEVKEICSFIATNACTILAKNKDGDYILTQKTFFGLEWNVTKKTFNFVNIDDSLHEVYKSKGSCDGAGYITHDYKIYNYLRAYVQERKEVRDAATTIINHILGMYAQHAGKNAKFNRIERDKARTAGRPEPTPRPLEPLTLRNMDLFTWEKDKDGKYKKTPILPKHQEQRDKVLSIVEGALSAGGLFISIEGTNKGATITVTADNTSIYLQ